MSLQENWNNFRAGHLSKADFIAKNYTTNYEPLFDLAAYLKNTEITKVEIMPEEVVMTFQDTGMRLACERHEYRTAPLETLNFLNYELAEVSIFNRLLDKKKSFYDIGGNIGYYSVNAALRNRELRVNVFEPIPKTYQALCRNVELNQLNSRISIHHFGLSDVEQNISFYVYPFGGTNASMLNVSDSPNAVEIQSRVIRLDQFVAEGNPPPDIIKCDVEGAEKMVVLGAMNTVSNFKPVMCLELLRKWSAKFGYHPNDIIQLLKAQGYSAYIPVQGYLQAFDLIDDKTFETNFFFLHHENHATHIKDLVR